MLSQRSWFMIASEHGDLLRVVKFEAEQIENHFKRPVASVYVVAQKQKVQPARIRIQSLLIYSFGVNNFFKHVYHVVELPVDVANDHDWLFDF